ncbi:HlyD family secretion protein [Inquilinus sp. NPDC058860]|uniref:HlyD family secretion protein n=1 Tax=Inquilinus sp. NPDC058860 TaxID=3346652 RepID=UPI0036D0EF7A
MAPDDATRQGAAGTSAPDDRNSAAPEDRRGVFARHRRAILIGSVAAVVLLAGAVGWWLHARNYESTDDAFIDARTVAVSPQISGAIVDVPVTDNQLVEAGAVLARIDDRDYAAALAQARAKVDQAKADIGDVAAQIEAQVAKVDQSRLQVAAAQAALQFAEDENKRAQDLVRTAAGTRQRADQASTDLRQRQAEFDGARASLTAADKQLGVLRAQAQSAVAALEQAEASLQQAQANQDRTLLTAPVAGRVAKLSAAKGAYASPGQSLMMLVPREVWITANFKETQLDLMRPGQMVSISIDAYPDRDFPGHVDSQQFGSGTAFALLPAENATGNYVKVVQRVPVKIVFDDPPDLPLGPGMSVVPTVTVR